MIAGLQAVEQQAAGRAHAGAERDGHLAALQAGQFFFQLAHRWVGPPRVDETLVAGVEAGEGPARVVEREGGRHDQVGRRRAGDRIGTFAGVDGSRLHAVLLISLEHPRIPGTAVLDE